VKFQATIREEIPEPKSRHSEHVHSPQLTSHSATVRESMYILQYILLQFFIFFIGSEPLTKYCDSYHLSRSYCYTVWSVVDWHHSVVCR